MVLTVHETVGSIDQCNGEYERNTNKHIMADKVNYISDADIKGFFDNLDHEVDDKIS